MLQMRKATPIPRAHPRPFATANSGLSLRGVFSPGSPRSLSSLAATRCELTGGNSRLRRSAMTAARNSMMRGLGMLRGWMAMPRSRCSMWGGSEREGARYGMCPSSVHLSRGGGSKSFRGISKTITLFLLCDSSIVNGSEREGAKYGTCPSSVHLRRRNEPL